MIGILPVFSYWQEGDAQGVLLGLRLRSWVASKELLFTEDWWVRWGLSFFFSGSSFMFWISSRVQLLWSYSGVIFELLLLSFKLEEHFGVKRLRSMLILGENGSMIGSLGMMGLVWGRGERSQRAAYAWAPVIWDVGLRPSRWNLEKKNVYRI